MKTFDDVISTIETVDLDQLHIDLIEDYNSDVPINMRIYKHLKRILNINFKYLDYIDDETVEYITTLTNDDRVAKSILILSILKAVQESTIADIVFINDLLLTYGLPNKNGLLELNKICSTKKEDWHNLWINTYTKM